MSFSLVAHAGANAASSPVTSAVDTTGANLLIAYVTGNNTTPTISDSKSNTWTLIKNTAANGGTSMWYVSAPTVGSGHTFTGGPASAFSAIMVQAWSGAASSTPLDQSNSGTTSSGNTVQPGSITPTQSNELVVTSGFPGLVVIDNPTVNLSFTKSDSFAGNSGVNYGGEGLAYLVQGAAAAVNPTWTWTGTIGVPGAIIASFKPGSGGGGFTAIFRRTLSQLGTRVGSRQIQAA